jgi:NADPH-dependent curcumin reductase CurA
MSSTAAFTDDLGNSIGSGAPKKVILKTRPKGPLRLKDLEVVPQDITDESKLEDGQVLVSSSLLSCDAFIRTMLDEQAYHGSTQPGDTLMALGVGTVVASKNKKFKVGARVAGALGAQSLGPVKPEMIQPALALPGVPESAALGLLGLTSGMTAWCGIHAVLGPPKRGQTVVVTAAAGAVGSAAAQFARNRGARVIGVAGGPEKCAYLVNDLKLSGAIDYKEARRDPKNGRSVAEQLDALAPGGVDFMMDQVGGDVLDVVLERMKPNARVVICGAISQYEGNLNHGKVQGPSNYLKLAEKGCTMKGFNVITYLYLLPWMLIRILISFWRGKVVMKETYHPGGIDAFPSALLSLLNGGHTGKMLVKV